MKQKKDNNFGVPFSDLLLQFIAVFFMFMIPLVLLPHSEEKVKNNAQQLGVMCIELSWPSRDIDLDLWGHSPGDPTTVGYTNMHGQHLDLYRDVLGFNHNPTHQMLEVQCANQMTPGEWTFNVNYYSNHEKEFVNLAIDAPEKAIEATMVVRVNKEKKDGKIYQGKWKLTKEGEEKTMFDFVVDNNGNIIESSINSNDHPLKGGVKVTRDNP